MPRGSPPASRFGPLRRGAPVQKNDSGEKPATKKAVVVPGPSIWRPRFPTPPYPGGHLNSGAAADRKRGRARPNRSPRGAGYRSLHRPGRLPVQALCFPDQSAARPHRILDLTHCYLARRGGRSEHGFDNCGAKNRVFLDKFPVSREPEPPGLPVRMSLVATDAADASVTLTKFARGLYSVTARRSAPRPATFWAFDWHNSALIAQQRSDGLA
jgi:hypothetical protein